MAYSVYKQISVKMIDFMLYDYGAKAVKFLFKPLAINI